MVINVIFIVGLKVYLFVGVVYVIFKVVLFVLICEMVYDFGLYGVWVNVIVLGEIDILILLLGIEEIVECSILLYCFGWLEEIVLLIYFFCISGVFYVNGVEIYVNGG